MAAKGAHLTLTSPNTPSIFEVVAQESLNNTIHPAFKRIAVFLASCNPERFGWIIKWFEEIFLVFNSLLQYHYLRKYDGSFSESFYGLRRVPLKSRVLSSLPKKELTLSLITLTLIPYLRIKLENAVVKYKLEGLEPNSTADSRGKSARNVIVNLHSVAHLCWEGTVLTQYLLYLRKQSPSHSPLLKLSGVSLEYITEAEEDLRWKDLWGNVRNGKIGVLSLSWAVTSKVLIHSLEIGAFFLQFLQWWYADDVRPNLTALPIPPPPKNFLNSSTYNGICPICQKTRKIETVLTVSGLVFCYRCIVNHLKKNKSCPVTKYPATMNDLVRIYIPQS